MRRSHYVCSFAVIYGTLSFLSQDHSYTEALVMTGTPDINTKGFSQYVFENADINARGFNRLNTFHAMSRIRCVTSKNTVEPEISVDRNSGTFNPKINEIRILADPKKKSSTISIIIKDYKELRLLSGSSPLKRTIFPMNMIWHIGINHQPG